MKLSKTLGLVLAALLTAASFVVSVKLGVVLVLVLLVVAWVASDPSQPNGVIGVDHVDRPHTGSYGGGFIPGGLLTRGGLGTQFGVYGTSVAGNSPLVGHRKEYTEDRRSVRSRIRRSWLAAAIKKAEARTGHQIVVVIGPLEEDHVAKADRLAAQWSSASIVVCIDPALGTYEVRWHDPALALDTAHLATFGNMMHRCKFAKAITLLAEALPLQAAVAELPDIVEE